MRMLRLPLAVLAAILLLSGAASAQIGGWDCINEYIDCGEISESSIDTIRVVNFQGAPGDTVWMPMYMKIKTDTISGFAIIINYDASLLTPVKASTLPQDSLYVAYQISGELLDAQNRYRVDHPGAEIFTAEISSNPFDSGAIACGFNLAVFGAQEMMNPMKEVIFSLGFKVAEGATTGRTAVFEFYEVNEYSVTDSGAFDAYCVDCRRSNLSAERWIARDICVDSIPIVDDTVEPWDTTGWACSQWVYDSLVTISSTLFPTSKDGIFTVNPCPPPTILAWGTSDPDDSVGVGDAFTLDWSVTDADSIVIFQGGSSIFTSYDLSGYTLTTAPATAGTYAYTLWAFSECDSATTSFNMLVGEGGTQEDPHAPAISVNSIFSVDVGSTLNFNVQATDIDGDFVTLEATVLPTGATFPTVQGTAPVTGSFSWTPSISQSGNHSATFRATDVGGLYTQRTVSIVVNEPEYDKLFTSSIEGSAVGGVPSKAGIRFPINLVTSQTVYGVQFDFVYNAENFEVTGVDVTANTADYIIYENIGVNPGEVRFIAFGMSNEPIGTDGTEILYVEMAVASDATPGLYPVYIEDAWESVDPDPTSPGLQMVSDSGIIMVDAYGDINLDVRVNVADLVSIVGYIIGDYGLDSRRWEVADVVPDSSVDVFDLVAIVNLIYGLPTSPAPGKFLDDQYAVLKLDYSDLRVGRNDVMTVRSELPVDIAGVELEILYDPDAVTLGVPTVTDDVSNIAVRTRDDGRGRMTILMYSTEPIADGAIHAGLVDLLEIPILAVDDLTAGDVSQMQLSRALLSTAQVEAVKVQGMETPLPATFVLKQNYPNPFNPSTTIEFTLGTPGSTGGGQVSLDIYNILGQNVKRLFNGYMPAGNHSIVWNGDDEGGQRVASGIYLYKLKVDAESQTKKMLLLK